MGTRQVKVESFAQRKQQRAPTADADLDRRGTMREAAEQQSPISSGMKAKLRVSLRLDRQSKSAPCLPDTLRLEVSSERSCSTVASSTLFTAKSGLVGSSEQLRMRGPTQ